MKIEKKLTILFILLLIILSSLTVSMLIRNKNLIKEAFQAETMCPPLTRKLKAKQSYNSLLKGHCGNVLSDYGDNYDYYDDNVNTNGNPYCKYMNAQTLSGEESYNTETKAKCAM